MGEQNDFVEVLGNVLDNACKYCLEFCRDFQRNCLRISCIFWLKMMVRVFRKSKREVVFDRGQRVDTLRRDKASVWRWREITEQYDGQIIAGDSLLGGARMGLFLVASSRARKTSNRRM